MKLLTLLFLYVHVIAVAQTDEDMHVIFDDEHTGSDTIFASTEPVEGYELFKKKLEKILSGADTIGKRYEIRLDNIAFIVGKTGKIDSAWIIFHKRPLYFEIVKQLKATPWRPSESSDGARASRQELNVTISLTKRTLKKHRSWPSFAERVLPWVH